MKKNELLDTVQKIIRDGQFKNQFKDDRPGQKISIQSLYSYKIILQYFLIVLALLLSECAAGVVASIWPRCLGIQNTRGGAVGALQGVAVPLSCCVQQAQFSSYLNPAPLNQSRCQEVAPNANYTHVSGCLMKLEDWYQQQYFIFMLALFVSAIFKLSLLLSTVFSCIRLRRRRKQIHMFVTGDNRTNENIYEHNTSARDEPITTKYIQPNSFYSPRVRNPKLFDTKPDDLLRTTSP
ncbi:unnamed protein product [Leptidea sinapis]|uniref:Uncharacterized protein n=1 Tax=Leptidea sinapis TaxID=189913 RepID=A0A5E4QZF1_9NEOP|nr:unnamed protein product [Leptidea sinapis]